MRAYIRRSDNTKLVLQLNSMIFPGDPLEITNNTEHWIARDSVTNRPVGFCSISKLEYGIVFLSRAGLLRNYRGLGLQRRMISVRQRYAKRNNYKKIITYVKNNNYSSLANLIKQGYKLYTPEYEYAGENFMYLIKYI